MLFFAETTNLKLTHSTNYLLSESDIFEPFFAEQYHAQALSGGMVVSSFFQPENLFSNNVITPVSV